MLAPEGQYYNYSGCGNTFNCNHPVVRKFIVDCLRYWVTEMHVDGFRFDLASILTRAHSQWHKPSKAPSGNGNGHTNGNGLQPTLDELDTGATFSCSCMQACLLHVPCSLMMCSLAVIIVQDLTQSSNIQNLSHGKGFLYMVQVSGSTQACLCPDMLLLSVRDR